METNKLIVFIAIFLALILAVKPEFIVLNENHRIPSLMKALRYIGMSVAIVLSVWFFSTQL